MPSSFQSISRGWVPLKPATPIMRSTVIATSTSSTVASSTLRRGESGSRDRFSAATSGHPPDPRAEPGELALDVLVAAVEVVDAVDGGLAVGHQDRKSVV